MTLDISMRLFFLKFLLLIFFLFPLKLEAQSLEITFLPDPLFSAENFLPGDTISGKIRIENQSSSPLSLYLWPENVIDPDNFASVLNLEIKKDKDLLYQNTLSHFFSQENLYLSEILPGQILEYLFFLNFDILAGNEYQGKSLQFDLVIGTTLPEKEEPEPEEEAEITVQAAGGGPAITLSIYNLKVKEVSTSTATITWQTTLFAKSQVIFSSENESHFFKANSPPLYGYSHLSPESKEKKTFHEVFLSKLLPCKTYYFRALSRNSSLAISPEKNFQTLCLPEKKIVEEMPKEKIEEEKEEIEKPREEIIYLPPKEIEKRPQPQPEEKIVLELPPEAPQPPFFFENLLAALRNIGSQFQNFPCLPCWLLLILAFYPLLKIFQALQKRKKMKKSPFGEIASWSFWLILLLALFFSFQKICFHFLIFLALILGLFLSWLYFFFLSPKKIKKVVPLPPSLPSENQKPLV